MNKKYRVILMVEDEKWFIIEAENSDEAVKEAKRQIDFPESKIVGFEIDRIDE